MSWAKTAEPIEMPFWVKTWVGPRKHVLDGGADPSKGRGNSGVGSVRCGTIDIPAIFTRAWVVAWWRNG